MKDLHDWYVVNRMFKEGVPKKKIARNLNISKNTVKRLLKLTAAPKYKREYYPTKIDKYKDQIRIWYLDPQYNFIGTRIYSELQAIGYEGSINPIYRFLATLKADKNSINKKATVRIETPYGDQAQFDWSEYKVDFFTEVKRVYCLTMILAASRKKAMLFSTSVDSDSIYESIQDLFYQLGGVTKELLIDNPKTLVISNLKDEEVKFNEAALKLSMHLGFELNPCRPYRARTKGKIEKPYQYIEEHFIKGNKFESLKDLNLRAKAFIEKWNNKKNGTTQRTPNDMYLEEKQYLLELPTNKLFENNLKKRKVSLDSMVSFESNKYSVPIKYADKEVFVRRIYGYKLEIYNAALDLIIDYEISEGKGKSNVLKEHYIDITSTTPKSIPEIKRKFLDSFENGLQYLENANKLLKQPSYHLREFLKLKELYESKDLDRILGYCITNDIYRIEDIRKILKEKYIDIIAEAENITTKEKIDTLNLKSALIRTTSYYEGVMNNETSKLHR